MDSISPFPLLELKHVNWQVGTKVILHDITFKVQSRDFIIIMGPSGAGKSSLIKLIIRLMDCTAGEILLENMDIQHINVIELRRRIGLLLQDSYMFDGTVRENVAYGPKLRNIEVDEKRMADLLHHVHLPPSILEQDAITLSGGERQRVALVRMLMNEPKILLLDEFTSALDPTSTHNVEQLIKSLHDSLGLTIIMISHDVEQAKRMGGICVFLVNGAIEEIGPSKDIFTNPKSQLTRKFVEGNEE